MIPTYIFCVNVTGKRDDPEETSDYHNVDPNSATGTNIKCTKYLVSGMKYVSHMCVGLHVC